MSASRLFGVNTSFGKVHRGQTEKRTFVKQSHVKRFHFLFSIHNSHQPPQKRIPMSAGQMSPDIQRSHL